MKTFSVTFEYYDYFFLQQTVCKYGEVKAENVDEAITRAHFVYGDNIKILEIEEIS